MNPAGRHDREHLAEDPPHYPTTRAGLAGRIAYALFPLRQNTVLGNLRLAFGDTLNEAELRDLARAFYSHLLRSLWEFLTVGRKPLATQAGLVRIEKPEIFFTALEAGRGVLLFGAHTGNFPVALTAAILQYPELRGRVAIVLRPFRPAWLRNLFWSRFARAGIDVLEKRGSMSEILRRLATSQTVGFVMDQHAAPAEGVRVNFFGRPAWTFRSLAVVARRSGAAVIPAAIWRERDGGHVFRLEAPLATVATADFAADLRVNTQLYNDALERIIRRHPEQWIWNHRRWKDA